MYFKLDGFIVPDGLGLFTNSVLFVDAPISSIFYYFD
jgi:hypothetical protein